MTHQPLTTIAQSSIHHLTTADITAVSVDGEGRYGRPGVASFTLRGGLWLCFDSLADLAEFAKALVAAAGDAAK